MEIHCMAPVIASPMQNPAAAKRLHRSQMGPKGAFRFLESMCIFIVKIGAGFVPARWSDGFVVG